MSFLEHLDDFAEPFNPLDLVRIYCGKQLLVRFGSNLLVFGCAPGACLAEAQRRQSQSTD